MSRSTLQLLKQMQLEDTENIEFSNQRVAIYIFRVTLKFKNDAAVHIERNMSKIKRGKQTGGRKEMK